MILRSRDLLLLVRGGFIWVARHCRSKERRQLIIPRAPSRIREVDASEFAARQWTNIRVAILTTRSEIQSNSSANWRHNRHDRRSTLNSASIKANFFQRPQQRNDYSTLCCQLDFYLSERNLSSFLSKILLKQQNTAGFLIVSYEMFN